MDEYVQDYKSERQLVTQMQEHIKALGGFVIKTSDKFTSGIPDLLVFYKGRTILIEVKTYKGIVSDIQQYIISQIRRRDCEAYIARDMEMLQKILDNQM